MINSVVIEWKNVCPMNYQSSCQLILNFMKRKQTPKTRSKKSKKGFVRVKRLWAISSQRFYRNPRPTNIAAVMRRLRDEVRNTNPDTLVRLCHELPAKMNEIYRLKGRKIPSNFDPRKSPFACQCSICSSWRDTFLSPQNHSKTQKKTRFCNSVVECWTNQRSRVRSPPGILFFH